MIKNCIICDTEFETPVKHRICCSHECRMKTPCIRCGKIDRYKNEECKYCKKKYNKNRYWKDPEKMRQEKKEYYENNKEEYKQKVVEWQANNPELVKRYKKKWKINNPDKVKLHDHKRRGLENNLSHEPYNFELICEFYDNKCLCCGEKTKLTVDHVIPISWNNCPGDIASNIQPLCQSCNCKKHNNHDIDYRWDKGIELLKYLENKK